MASKEDAKNMALLFFMDHLMSKNGTRTIHDLSCQFGSRGFTDEMREAVGTSQEGLCEFLRQFPSLFTLEGDTVSINMYGDLALGGSKASPLLANLTAKDRDYEKEAIAFFENKLLKFGPELQIKSLLGHRSQAAPEIRLVSGRHVKDFADFLASCTEKFEVEGDRVRLKNMPEPTAPNAEYDSDGQPLTGAKAKEAAVDYLKSYVEAQEVPIPLETVYREFCSRFPHAVRQEVATNPKELLQFLKLNRAIFFIRSNKVSLVKNRPGVILGENGEVISPAPGSPQHLDSIDGDSSTTSSLAGDLETRGSSVSPPKPSISVAKALKQAQSMVPELLANVSPPSGVPVPRGVAGVLSLDAKMVSLGGQDFLALIVLGTANDKVFVFDVAHSAAMLVESGLKDILEAKTIVKVIHDCKRLSSVLKQQYQIQLESVFDTQVINAALQHQRNGRPVAEVKPITFLALQRLYHPQSLMAADSNPQKLQKHDAKFWSQRPLTDDVVEAAVEDVRLLVPFIYVSMQSMLKPGYESVLRELAVDNVHFVQHLVAEKETPNDPKSTAQFDDKFSSFRSAASDRFFATDNNNSTTAAIGFQSDRAPMPALRAAQNGSGGPDRRSSADADLFNGHSLTARNIAPGDPPGRISVKARLGPRVTPGAKPVTMTTTPENGERRQQQQFRAVLRKEGPAENGSGPPREGKTDPGQRCACCCHSNIQLPQPPIVVQVKAVAKPSAEVACQTLSTGDVVMTKLFYEGNN